jgi:hypothetical protein
MCSRISISISRWPWRRRESRTHAAWGATGGASAPGEAWPLRRLPQSPHDNVRPRSGPSRHLVVGVDVARPRPAGRRHRAARCAARRPRAETPERAGATPRLRRYAAPALTPRGVAPALVDTTKTIPSRQPNRRPARGGLPTAMRPIVPSVFIERCRCLSDRSAAEETPQIV